MKAVKIHRFVSRQISTTSTSVNSCPLLMSGICFYLFCVRNTNFPRTLSAFDWIFSSMNVANPSESHSSLQSLAPTRSPNQACEISCASRTRMLASPERRDWDRNTRLGLKDKKKEMKVTLDWFPRLRFWTTQKKEEFWTSYEQLVWNERADLENENELNINQPFESHASETLWQNQHVQPSEWIRT